MKICTVCKSNNFKKSSVIDNLVYWTCIVCEAKLLDSKHFISLNAEKKHYLKHINSIDDVGYKNFISQFVKIIKDIISIGSIGLDYGCGYAPALAHILKKEGFQVDIYDPFFFPNNLNFLRKFNFITCTEVIEHFFNPHEEFKKIDSLLYHKGFLAIKTSLLSDDIFFDKWHYRRDPTHVVFYQKKTFEIIAKQRKWIVCFPEKNIIILKKNSKN